MNIGLDLSRSGLGEEDILNLRGKLQAADKSLHEGKEGFNGWMTLPTEYNREEFERILEAADRIKKSCDVLIVIGIGGSYLGAKACIEMMSHSFSAVIKEKKRRTPLILFAGQNISPSYHSELMEAVKDNNVCLCVISKSGTTAEPNIAFAVLKEMLYEKYGREEARSRIYAVTDRSKGMLREEADREGYESFVIPEDVGGRYSVLTPAGLLPIAAAGIDIREIMKGAASGVEEYRGADPRTNICCRYAAARYLLDRAGKKIEIYECYEPKMYFFGEWLKQLFGESEGKEGKGLFPALLQFTTDLHSMGQFIQEGSQIFFETVINIENPEKDVMIPDTAAEAFRGKTMHQVNRAAVKGVAEAHADDKIPVIFIDISEISPYLFGKMVYFFERSCALKGYMMGINPFDQPGVEKYKAFMKEKLNE
ncbi:MAG: glucose-6-phosphate isomerase [Firmicutes bacterium]|nr:glucose-6-phosphate isomerase [Bacillota bacterium]